MAVQAASVPTSAGKTTVSETDTADGDFSRDLGLLLRSVGRSPAAAGAADAQRPSGASAAAFDAEFDADLRDLTAKLASA